MADGYNYRIDDLRSTLVLAQLEKLPKAYQRRQQLACSRAEHLAISAGTRLLASDSAKQMDIGRRDGSNDR